LILDVFLNHEFSVAKVFCVVIVLLLIQSNAENGAASANAADEDSEIQSVVLAGFKRIYKFFLSFFSHFKNHV